MGSLWLHDVKVYCAVDPLPIPSVVADGLGGGQFALHDVLGQGYDLGHSIAWYEHHAVLVADDEIALADSRSTDGDVSADGARAILIWALVRNASSEDRDLQGSQLAEVADGTVKDDSGDPTGLGVTGQQSTDNGPVNETSGVDHEDITGRG